MFLTRLDELRACLRKELAALREVGGGPACGWGTGAAGLGRVSSDNPDARLGRLIRSGDRQEMLALAGAAVQGVLKRAESSPGEFTDLLRQVKVSLDWASTLERINGEDGGPDFHGEAVREFEDILINELDRELGRRRPEYLQEVTGRVNLAEADFSCLSLEQVEEIKKTVAKMARSLATRPSYRRARSKKGEVDLRRTARQAAQRGGVPLVLSRRAKIPHRPELVVLCDLSGSVSLFTGFMLQLIWAVQHRFKNVRTFGFVDDVGEITGFIKGRDPGEAVTQVLREARIARTPFSDYGAVWREFCLRYLDLITCKTTVLVLGDARNNWKPPGDEYLKKLRDRAARLVWLNPAPRERWDQEDSIISTYSPYCHRLFECRNLRQLGDVARYLGRI